MLDPATGHVEINGTAPQLRQPTIGQYLRGIYVLDAQVGIDKWIGRTMQMFLRFRNGDFLSGPVVWPSVQGFRLGAPIHKCRRNPSPRMMWPRY